MFSGKAFDNLKIYMESPVDTNKKTDDIQPLDTFNIWKRSLVDTKLKRSWIRSNLSDGARQRFIYPTFSKTSPVLFFSLGIFLSPSVEIFFKLNWTNCDEFISSGNHTYPVYIQYKVMGQNHRSRQFLGGSIPLYVRHKHNSSLLFAPVGSSGHQRTQWI